MHRFAAALFVPLVLLAAPSRLPAQEAGRPPADLAEAVAVLASAPSVDGSSVGYAGVETPAWGAYLHLRDHAPAEELTRLLGHERPVVRVYALQALVDRHPEVDLLPLLLGRLDDRAPVETMDGCIHSTSSVADEAFGLIAGRLSSPARERVLEVLLAQRPPIASLGSALEEWEMPERFLAAVRTLAKSGAPAAPAALTALARFRRPEDVPLISGRLVDATWYALRAIRRFPHADFLPLLRAMHPALLAETHHSTTQREFYAAAAGFGAAALDLLSAPFDPQREVPMRSYQLDRVFEALADKEDPAFVPLLFRLWEERGKTDARVFDRLWAADRDRALGLLEKLLDHQVNLIDVDSLRVLLARWNDARGAAGLDVLNHALARADVQHFPAVADEAARLRSEGALEVLLRRFDIEDNPCIYLAAAKAVLAYGRPELKTRLRELGADRRKQAADWGAKELEALLAPSPEDPGKK